MLDDSAISFRNNLPVLPPIDERAQERLRITLQQRQTADFYFLIDVVGTCTFAARHARSETMLDPRPRV